jgi:hypothetical protein
MLTNLPVYRSVATTLYGLAWTDMSFFSEPSRHGDLSRPYPAKDASRWLVVAVLALGLVPTALAAVGFLVTVRDRRFWPLTVLTVLTVVAYGYWVVAQPVWALKTKYVLFLLPAFVLWALAGRDAVRRLGGPAAGAAATVLLVLAAVASEAYLFQFALGGP